VIKISETRPTQQKIISKNTKSHEKYHKELPHSQWQVQ
jgi:hypothetical protein